MEIDTSPPYLRDLAEQLDFYIGTAVGYGSATFPNNARYMKTLKREFNAVVAEYTMKWGTSARTGERLILVPAMN